MSGDPPGAVLPVLYIGSWGRSGSTLVDLLVGRLPGFVSVGELRYLWERGLAERQRCGCGAAVPDCPFWGAVLEEAFGGVARVDLQAVLALWQRIDRLARVPWLAAARRPPALERDLAEFRNLLGPLYRAVRTVSGAGVVVDSSKYASYGLILAGVPGLELRVLHLVRDSRAVAYSWLRRKRMPEVTEEERYMPLKRPSRSAVFWGLENLALELLRGRARAYGVLRYDEVAADPAGAIRQALERLGLPGDVSRLGGNRFTLAPNHTVAGNPLRFERSEVAIRPDQEWLGQLGPGARRLVTALTWPLLRRYGFPLRPGAG